MTDFGSYNKDQVLYENEVQKLCNAYPDGVTLSSEYASFIQNSSLNLLIRLARYKFIARLLSPTDSVLEVGCGSGLGSLFLAQHCREVLGIDVKSSEVELARQLCKRKNASFLERDLFDDSLGGQFDAVCSLDVIEHMDSSTGSRFLRRCFDLCKPNGFVVIGTPSIHSYPYQSAISQASHVKCYDLPELQELVNTYAKRSFFFSMNDELVHTGNHRLAWYYFAICIC